MIDPSSLENVDVSEISVSDALHILSRIGKLRQREFEPAVRRFMEHPDVNVRAQAIEVLGAELQVDEFERDARRLWVEATAVEIRVAALRAWVAYSRSTQSLSVVEELKAVVLDVERHWLVRSTALNSLFIVWDGRGSMDLLRERKGLFGSNDTDESRVRSIVAQFRSDRGL